jgi:hypothetical protein
MSIAGDMIAADQTGAPMLRGAMRLSRGGVFTGWSAISRRSDPFEVSLHHGLGAPLYAIHTWFWRGGAPPSFFSWSSKRPHPDEAGPVLVRSTPDWVHFTFEGGKPLFAEYDVHSGRYQLIGEGWIGALLLPG